MEEISPEIYQTVERKRKIEERKEEREEERDEEYEEPPNIKPRIDKKSIMEIEP